MELIIKGQEGLKSRIFRYITDYGKASRLVAAPKITTKILNKIGNAYSRVKNTPVSLPITPAGGATTYNTMGQYMPRETTTVGNRVGEVFTSAMIPGLAVGAATMGVPATVGGLVGGAALAPVGNYVGSGLANVLGGNENAQEMFGDVGELAGMGFGAKVGTGVGDFTGLAHNINRNLSSRGKGVFDFWDRLTIANRARRNPGLRDLISDRLNIFNFNSNLSSVNLNKNGIINRLFFDVENGNNSANDFAFLNDSRFYNDLNSGQVWGVRLRGQYPLTFTERRNWINQFKDDVNNGIRFVRDERLNDPNFTGTSPENAQNIASLLRDMRNRNMTLEEEWDAVGKLERLGLNDRILRLSNAEDNTEFGTLNAIRHRSDNELDFYPYEQGYIAYASDGKTYYPFRGSRESLYTIPSKEKYSPTQTGAHEYEHVILEMHNEPLTNYSPKDAFEYGRYTNENLPESLRNAASAIIDKAGTKGTWEGSLSEMDSELKGWRAENNYPKYTDMTPEQLLHIISLANRRFGIADEDKQLFHNLFLLLEAAGYKNGGKLIRK